MACGLKIELNDVIQFVNAFMCVLLNDRIWRERKRYLNEMAKWSVKNQRGNILNDLTFPI